MRAIKVNKRKTAGVWKRILALMLVICCLPFGDYVQAFGAAMPEAGQKGVEGTAESVPASVSGNFTDMQQDVPEGVQTNGQENGQADAMTDGNSQAQGEESSDSRVMEFEDMTVTEDLTLEADMETGNLLLMQGELNLNGYTLTVHGDCIQPGGSMVINGGKLITDGDYRIQTRTAAEVGASEEGGGAGENGLESVQYDYDYSTGTLTMTDSRDYVQVFGDFVTDSDKNHTGLLSDGVLEVWGNFTQLNTKSNYSFRASQNHKVYLTGTSGKTVSFSYDSYNSSRFANLEINLNMSHEIEEEMPSGTGKNVNGETEIDVEESENEPDLIFWGEPFVEGCIVEKEVEEKPVIEGNIRIHRDTRFETGYYCGNVKLVSNFSCYRDLIIDGNLNCNKKVLYVSEHLTVKGEVSMLARLYMEWGNLTVEKDLVFEGCSSRDDGLIMKHDSDYIMVGGDFIYRGNLHKNSDKITAGTLEIKGNFNCEEMFYATGSQRVLLSGTGQQNIIMNIRSRFHILELQNYSEEGVYAEDVVVKDILIRNGCRFTYGSMEEEFGWTLTEDTVIEDDLVLVDDVLDLNGYTLTVKGDLIHANGEIFIHGGRLLVDGDYRMQMRRGEEGNYNYEKSTGILKMTDETDYILIKGGMYVQTIQSLSGFLTAGTIELKGNFYDFCQIADDNFATAGSHTMYLTGNTVQKISFEGYGPFNCIQNLKVDNAVGLVFETAVSVKGNIDISSDIKVEGRLCVYKTTTFSDNLYRGDIIAGNLEWTYDLVVDGNLYVGQNLTISSCRLTVKGDVLVEDGVIGIDKGELIVGNDLSFQWHSQYNNTALGMSTDDSYILVNGNFNYYAKRSYVIAGTLEVKGDFTTNATFKASGTHKVILSGDEKQTITMADNARFHILELRNYGMEGVWTARPTLDYDILISNGCKLNYGNLQGNSGFTLNQDMVIGEDFILTDGVLDLNSHKLTIKGDFLHAGGTVEINGGTLEVQGDYRLQWREEIDGMQVYGSGYGKLLMNSDEDTFVINGNCIIEPSKITEKDGQEPLNAMDGWITGGTISIGGDLGQLGKEAFIAGGSSTVCLNGSKKQSVAGVQDLRIGNFAIENTSKEGVFFLTDVQVEESLSDLNKKAYGQGYAVVSGSDVLENGIFGGNLKITNAETLARDLEIGGSLYIENTMKLNGHSVSVGASLIVDKTGSLIMQNARDVMAVGGDMKYSSTAGSIMSAGILQVEGNFTKASGARFVAGGEHVTVLSGKEGGDGSLIPQNIDLSGSDGSRFHKLILKQPLAEGYVFSVPPEQIADEVIYEGDELQRPGPITSLQVTGQTVNSITISYEPPASLGEIAGYKIYRDGRQVVMTEQTTYTDGRLEADREYVYKVYAVDANGNTAKASPECRGKTLTDVTPPSVVPGLTVSGRTGSAITLSWNPAADDSKVCGYNVYRNGELMAEGIENTEYKDCGLAENTLYTYTVTAVDGAGNESLHCEGVDGAVCMPKILSVTPEDYESIGGESVTLRVTFKDAGSSTGNRVDIAFYDEDKDIWKAVTKVSLGQSRLNDTTLYAETEWDLTALTKDGDVDVRFRVTDEDGNSREQIVTYYLDRKAPEQVTGIKVSDEGGTLRVKWDRCLSADTKGYLVYRMEEGTGKYIVAADIENGDITAWTDRDVETGKVYIYHVRAYDAFDQKSVLSERVSATVGQDQEAPRILSLSPSGGKVSGQKLIQVSGIDNRGLSELRLYIRKEGESPWSLLGWADVSDKGREAAENQERSGKGDGNDSLEADCYIMWNTLKYPDGNYELKAEVSDTSGNMNEKEFIRFYQVDNSGIGKIILGEVSSTSTAVQLTWEDVTEEDFGYFAVERFIDGNFVQVARVTDKLGANVENLKPGTEYTFRVVGYDVLGNRGEASDIIKVRTTEDAIAPSIRSIEPAPGRFGEKLSLKMKVSDNASVGSGMFSYSLDKENYTVLASRDGQGGKEETFSYEWDISALPEGEVYVKFEAMDEAGNANVLAEGEEIICTYVIDHTPPDKITGAAAEGGEGFIHLSWNEPLDDDIQAFIIYRAGNDGVYRPIQKDCRTKDYYDVALQAGDSFTYRISAIDTAGNEGEKSDPVSGMALRDEEAPVVTGISPEKGSRQGSNVTLKIFAKDNAALSAVVAEYREKDTEELWREIGRTEGTERYIYSQMEWNTEGLREGCVYEVRAKAVDKAGNVSEYVYSEYDFDLTAPASPKLEADSGSFRVELSWSENEEEDFDIYKIYRAEAGSDHYVCIQTTEENAFTDMTVEPDTMYTYKVAAWDIYGNNSESNKASSYGNSIDTIAPEAILPENIMGVSGLELGFDGTASFDNVRIVTYEWDFGDGSGKKGTRPTHIYEKPGTYTVTLTVSDAWGNQDKTTTNVIIRDKDNNGMITITITDESGNPLPYAYVYIRIGNSDEDILNLRADGSGRVRIAAKEGIYQYAAYLEEYLPKESTFRIDSGSSNTAVLGLEKGEVMTGELEVHRMELQELVEAGVDLSAPENFHTFTFKSTFIFKESPIPVVVEYVGNMTGGRQNVIRIYDMENRKYEGTLNISLIQPEEEILDSEEYVPTIAILQVTQSVSWLKEMYGVNLTITNHSGEGFDIEHAVADLSLPEGVSLAATKTGQTLSQPMEDIKGGTSRTANWVVKGDVTGEYTLKASFHGVLMPFEANLDADFEAESEFEVEGGKGLHIYVMPENAYYIGESYYVQYKIVNESDRTFYNLTTTLGEYIQPQVVQETIVLDPETGEVTNRIKNMGGMTYRSAEAAKCRTAPVMYQGDAIEVGVFAPGDTLYGTYCGVPSGAAGDPDEVYFQLVGSLTQILEGENLGVKVTTLPIASHYSKSKATVALDPFAGYYGDPIDTVTGAFTQDMTLLSIGGGDTISMDLSYNSMLAGERGSCGYGFAHSYEQSIEDRGNSLVLHMTPYSQTTFLSKDAAENKAAGTWDGDKVILSDTAVYYGDFLPVTTDMEGYRIEKTEEGYILHMGEEGGELTFDTEGRIVELKDTDERTVSLLYGDNTMTVTENVSKESLYITYNDEGFITTVRDDHGRMSALTYDGEGNLSSYTDPMGNTARYEYDSAHRMIKAYDGEGCAYVSNAYDEEGRVISQEEAGKGPAARLSYETMGNNTRITITDHNGNTTSLTNDGRGNRIEEINGAGSRTTYLYDRQGNLLDIWDHYHNNTAYEYDEEKRTTAVYDTAGNVTRYHYDESGNMTTLTGADGSMAHYSYDAKGNITKITEPSGAVTSYTYDAFSRVVSESKTDCGTMYYEYDGKGRIAAVTDYNGNRSTLEYDEYGNISRATDACGGVKTYVYNANGWLMSETDEAGCITEYTYDKCGRQLSKTRRDAVGTQVQTSSYTYYESGLLKSETDPEGGVTTYVYDNEGHILSVTYPAGTTDTYTYDAAYHQTGQKDPDGTIHAYTYDMLGNNTSVSLNDRTVTFEYYPNGKIRKQTNEDGTWLLYTYDKRWNCIQVMDKDGVGMSYAYDGMDRLISERDALGNTTRYEYDTQGRITKTTDPNGNATTYEYDGNGNCIRMVNALSRTTEMEYDKADRLIRITQETGAGRISAGYTYDKAGRVTAVTDEEGNTTRYTYDVFGNVLTVTDALGNPAAANTYDKTGNLISTTDGEGTATGYAYDRAGNLLAVAECLNGEEETSYAYEYDENLRLTKTTDPISGTTVREYDAYGNIISVTDAMGGTTRYNYDERNRITSVISALGNQESYTYNAQGLLAEEENARGQKAAYTYDKAGRLTEKKDEAGTITYIYDNNGNVLRVTEEDGEGNKETISRTYDALNRVTSMTDCRGNTVKYGYDELGNRISLTYPGGEIVRCSYYKNGNLKTVTDWEGNVTSYEYDGNGRLLKTTRSDGSVETRTYNKAGYLMETLDVTAAGEEISHYTYGYDGRGNITSIEGKDNGIPGITAGAVMTYDEDNRLVSYNGEAVTYDADGNMLHGPLQGQMADYVYDCRNRLISVTTADGKTTRYEYDAENTRTAMETEGRREEYVTDTESTYSQVLEVKVYEKEDTALSAGAGEADSTGTVHTENTAAAYTASYVYGLGLIGEKGKNGWLYYHYDHLGSTAALTGNDGEVRLRFAYSAYGELTGITDGTGNSFVNVEDGKITSSMISGAVSETGICFLYNGQLGVTTDGNGLYHMRARYYNTDIKRFINRDILTGDITNSQSLNRYSYVQGNPVSSTDPFGLCPLGFLNLDWSTIGHALLDVVGIFWDGADLINALWYKAEGNDFMAGVCLLSALPMLGSFAGGTIKAVATGTKYLNKAETVAKYLTLGTKLVSHTAQATMSGIDTYYAAVDAYEVYQAGELGAEEIINLGLAATGTVLSTGAAISSGRGLYKLMGSDGVGCKVLTGITGEPHCFVAGTPVSTEEGQRAIEEVEAGDKVWAYNEETGEKGLKEVEEVFVSETDKLVHVETDKEEIVTTELHPFYVEGLGFVQAGCLQEGYELKCLDGGRETITGIRVEWLEEAITVYNFEVADYHTYYVGDGDVLVHNTCSKTSGSEDNLLLLETSQNISDEINDHHIIPKFRGKSKRYADFISARGINVDDYTITVGAGKGGTHMNLLHGKGGWNQRWIEFIDNNPDATAKDIYQFAGKMMDDYGLNGYVIHPYKKK